VGIPAAIPVGALVAVLFVTVLLLVVLGALELVLVLVEVVVGTSLVEVGSGLGVGVGFGFCEVVSGLGLGGAAPPKFHDPPHKYPSPWFAKWSKRPLEKSRASGGHSTH
jgi:hypothetical protein